MYLYKDGLRYNCALDTIQESRKENVFKILQVMNDLGLSNEMIIEKIPFSFAKSESSSYTSYVSKEQWPHLMKVLTTITGKSPTSIRIFKDAMRMMNGCRWVYSYEYNYTSFIVRNFGIDFPEPVHLDRKMILVPDIFEDIILATVISEEKCQAI